jgi:phosphate transport system protein
MGDETRKQFHEALDDVRADIVRLAAMATEAIPRATSALLTDDLAAAQHVIDDDDVVDRQSLEIEEACLKLLALQQPMASDLRSLVTALKLNWELERSADLAVNVCKSARRMHPVRLAPGIRRIIEQMSDEAYRLMRLAVDAYVGFDAALAAALDDMDDRLDALQVDLIRAILAAHQSDVMPLIVAVQLALVGRYYERIGDHAVNIGERVEYLVTGAIPG